MIEDLIFMFAFFIFAVGGCFILLVADMLCYVLFDFSLLFTIEKWFFERFGK